MAEKFSLLLLKLQRNRNRNRNRKRPTRQSRPQVPNQLLQQTGIQWVRLGGWYESPTNGSGQISGVLPSDPTIINNGTDHPEYAAWSALFSEIRIVSLQATFFPRFAESQSVSTDGTPLAIAGSTNIVNPPTSIDVVLDNASSQAWNFLNDASPKGFTFTFRYKDLLWAASASPGGITSTGTPGGIGFYGLGYAASTFGVFIKYSAVYQMRNRI